MRLAAALVLVLVPLTLARAEEAAPEQPASEEAAPTGVEALAIAKALDTVKDRSTIDLSTVGRKTERIHTRPVWFVVADGRILVQSGEGGKTDWYLNVQKHSDVTLRTEDFVFRAHARLVTDPVEVERVHRLFLDKYRTAWLLSFLGSRIGRGAPVELIPDSVQGRPQG